MNISEAKTQIKNAMRAYFAKDEYGAFRLPPQSQRPVFLMGPPGIGKTAIMQEIAGELGVGLLSYSMTHHTRQSALGLPLIVKKSYGGAEYSVTEYTMSEIIASVYDMMEETGVREGILFLDEINCVSETLVPTMLQFLQYKTFGRHAVPGGWIVVTAGNPTEYNRGAREFDIVTWDRLKRIDIEPDYAAWKDYAVKKGVHPAVLTYLDARKDSFYQVRPGSDGDSFVTARAWDDLSDMLRLCESEGIETGALLVEQYIQSAEIAEDFSIYLELFKKYRSDYKLELILSGSAPKEIKQRAREAAFDERLSLLGLLLDAVRGDMRAALDTEDTLKELLGILRDIKAGASTADSLLERRSAMEKAQRRGALSDTQRRSLEYIIAFLARHNSLGSDLAAMKADFDGRVADMKAQTLRASQRLESLFGFAEEVWEDGQELLVIVTELTGSAHAARFIAAHGSEGYYRSSERLMFFQRHTQIIKQLERLETEL